MTPNDITQLISTVGFPIVCCGALFYYTTKVQKELTDSINRMNETMKIILEYVRGGNDDEV